MVLIIVDVGINHDGNINLAHEMVRQAAICGAGVVKFQAYSVDALFHPEYGQDPNEEIWKGVKPLEFNKEQFAQIKKWCDEEGIEFCCSVFDKERLGWMEELGVKRHKIASRVSKLDRELAMKIIDTGKPCLMSLGFNSKPFTTDYENLQYLYCVSEYPTEYGRIGMPDEFRRYVPEYDEYICYEGFSDHSLGIEASLVAVARGATIIEKHFTLDKSAKGFDHIVSCTPEELKDLVKYARLMEKVVKHSR